MSPMFSLFLTVDTSLILYANMRANVPLKNAGDDTIEKLMFHRTRRQITQLLLSNNLAQQLNHSDFTSEIPPHPSCQPPTDSLFLKIQLILQPISFILYKEAESTRVRSDCSKLLWKTAEEEQEEL